MKKILASLVDSFNIKKQAQELGVKTWQAPSFLFLLMGVIIIGAMFGVYWISKFYDSPEILVISEVSVVSVLFTIGNFIIKSIEEIAKANRMKSEFVSVASHQLKTPLTEANWQIELLLSAYAEGLTEKQREIVASISGSMRRMSRLVSDLLDVAKIEQGKLGLVSERVNVCKLVNEVVEDAKVLARASGSEIEVMERCERPEFMGDPRRIKMVIENLISNSVKYIGSRGRIEVAVSRLGESLKIEIRDNGVGIPKSQQHRIFQKFFRSDNVVRYQTEGTGLGLYIAKSIVEQSGGKIWFKSEEGRGTTFAFSLPAHKANNN